MADRVYNFCAGPATLPQPSLEEAQRDLVALPGIGMSVMELSHRSKQFSEIIETAEANLRQLLNISDDYSVLFLHGGASLQFCMVPMNLLHGTGKPADFILTGSWGAKAIVEARREGEVRVAWDGKPDNYTEAPAQDQLDLDPNAAYLHYTSNQTIQGVQFPAEPDAGDVPLVCDASSDILSRVIDVNKYGVIYAGAQKNIGPAGMAVTIIRNDLLERCSDDQHGMLNYKIHAENNSLFNTPPAWCVYFVMLTTKWLLEDIGGVAKMEEINKRKAAQLYGAIDQSDGFYKGHAKLESRSDMNVTWNLPNEELQASFLAQSEERGLMQLKGHRSVGGIRASIYNAMPPEGVQALCNFMEEFRAANQ